MDWIHCNSCYLLPTLSNGRKFVLTSCGHVYCENCVKSDGTKKCLICGNTFTMIPLTSELNADIQEYFRTPEDMLKRALQVLTFQEGHRSRITAYFNNVILKYKAAKQEIVRLNGIIKKQDKDYRDLEHQFILFKQKLQSGTASFAHSNSSSNITSQVQPSNSKEFSAMPSEKNTIPVSAATHMNSGNLADRNTFSQDSKRSALQVYPWMTPRRLTLRKVTPPSSGSSSLGSPNLHMFSPMTPQKTFNYSSQYRTNTQYSPQSSTPSTPGTPVTPECSRFSPLNGRDSETPSSTVISRHLLLSNTDRMLNNLTLTLHQPRGK